eukprot:193083-Rhodomonas_salina.3
MHTHTHTHTHTYPKQPPAPPNLRLTPVSLCAASSYGQDYQQAGTGDTGGYTSYYGTGQYRAAVLATHTRYNRLVLTPRLWYRISGRRLQLRLVHAGPPGHVPYAPTPELPTHLLRDVRCSHTVSCYQGGDAVAPPLDLQVGFAAFLFHFGGVGGSLACFVVGEVLCAKAGGCACLVPECTTKGVPDGGRNGFGAGELRVRGGARYNTCPMVLSACYDSVPGTAVLLLVLIESGDSSSPRVRCTKSLVQTESTPHEVPGTNREYTTTRRRSAPRDVSGPAMLLPPFAYVR